MSKESKTFYEFGPFRLDVVERQVWRGEEEIPLTQKSFGVLLVLLKNYGHLVKKEVFLRQVWPGVNVEEKNLTDNISILRKALGDHPKKSIYIKTVPRQGYRFAGDVTV